MGQTIEINGARRIGEVLVIDSNRTLAGQDGEAFTESPSDGETFPALLAQRIFAVDETVTRVHVMSNAVSVSRVGGWDETAQTEVEEVVIGFFRYYPDGARPDPSPETPAKAEPTEAEPAE